MKYKSNKNLIFQINILFENNFKYAQSTNIENV